MIKATCRWGRSQNVYAVIWTTTPWTMPANVAIAIHPEFEYVWVESERRDLSVCGGTNRGGGQSQWLEKLYRAWQMKGADLEGMIFAHPFIDRQSPVVLADYVTLEQGTGCVHTAPGHGQEDFDIGVKYGLPIINPVDHAGRFTAEGGLFQGMIVEDANVPVIKELAGRGMLLVKARSNINMPIAGAVKIRLSIGPPNSGSHQWMAFATQALQAIKEVQWIPTWGEERIHNMVADRHDWCISRQRVWGVPIPIFYCEECNEHIINDTTITAVKELFRREGSDAWWANTAAEILPDGFSLLRIAAIRLSVKKPISWMFGLTVAPAMLRFWKNARN